MSELTKAEKSRQKFLTDMNLSVSELDSFDNLLKVVDKASIANADGILDQAVLDDLTDPTGPLQNCWAVAVVAAARLAWDVYTHYSEGIISNDDFQDRFHKMIKTVHQIDMQGAEKPSIRVISDLRRDMLNIRTLRKDSI